LTAGLCPNLLGEAYSAPPGPFAGFRGEGRDGEGRDRPAQFLVVSDAYAYGSKI